MTANSISPAEDATIRAFIARGKRNRYLSALANPKKRSGFLDCLNHCHDFDGRFTTPIPSTADVAAILKEHGAPSICNVISDSRELDGRVLPLAQAIEEAESLGFGTIFCCIQGQLAYYLDEAGTERRLLLTRPAQVD